MNNKYLLTENELEHQLIQCCIQGNICPCFIFAPCVPFDIVCKFNRLDKLKRRNHLKVKQGEKKNHEVSLCILNLKFCFGTIEFKIISLTVCVISIPNKRDFLKLGHME